MRTLARPSLERNGRPQSPSADWTRRRTSSPKTASPRPAGGAFHASQSRAPGMLFLGNWLFALVGHMPTQGGGRALRNRAVLSRPSSLPPRAMPARLRSAGYAFARACKSLAAIAQLGERQTEDLKVPGSIPGLGIPCQGWGLSAAACAERQTSAPCGKSGARLGRHVSASDEEMVHGSGHLASEDKGSCSR